MCGVGGVEGCEVWVGDGEVWVVFKVVRGGCC